MIQDDIRGWDWGPELGLGLRVGLLPVTGRATLGIETTIRGGLTRSEESWTSIRYVSAGLVLEW